MKYNFLIRVAQGVSRRIKKRLRKIFPKKVVRVENFGNGNCLSVVAHSDGGRIRVVFHGNNNKVKIGKNCTFYKTNCIFIQGDNNEISIGSNTTFDGKVLLMAGEGTRIELGDDCMLAYGVTMRTSDQHPIYDTQGNRMNPAQDISIGSHVWFGTHSTVMKGVKIGSGSIIGYGAIVTKSLPDKCIAVGFPAQPIKRDVEWKRTF